MDAAQSFQLVHVRPETITHTVVPVVEAEPVRTFSPEWLRADGRAHTRGAAGGVLAQAGAVSGGG